MQKLDDTRFPICVEPTQDSQRAYPGNRAYSAIFSKCLCPLLKEKLRHFINILLQCCLTLVIGGNLALSFGTFFGIILRPFSALMR
jgi:hypothetical protein